MSDESNKDASESMPWNTNDAESPGFTSYKWGANAKIYRGANIDFTTGVKSSSVLGASNSNVLGLYNSNVFGGYISNYGPLSCSNYLGWRWTNIIGYDTQYIAYNTQKTVAGKEMTWVKDDKYDFLSKNAYKFVSGKETKVELKNVGATSYQNLDFTPLKEGYAETFTSYSATDKLLAAQTTYQAISGADHKILSGQNVLVQAIGNVNMASNTGATVSSNGATKLLSATDVTVAGNESATFSGGGVVLKFANGSAYLGPEVTLGMPAIAVVVTPADTSAAAAAIAAAAAAQAAAETAATQAELAAGIFLDALEAI
jgi:hypothetical protein